MGKKAFKLTHYILSHYVLRKDPNADTEAGKLKKQKVIKTKQDPIKTKNTKLKTNRRATGE